MSLKYSREHLEKAQHPRCRLNRHISTGGRQKIRQIGVNVVVHFDNFRQGRTLSHGPGEACDCLHFMKLFADVLKNNVEAFSNLK